MTVKWSTSRPQSLAVWLCCAGRMRDKANNDLSYSKQTEFRGMDEACLLEGRDRVMRGCREREAEIVVAGCSVNLLVYGD